MRLFVWDNDDGEFNTGHVYKLAGLYSSGAHSGGFVVVASDPAEAVSIIVDAMRAEVRKDDDPDAFHEAELREYLAGNVKEKPADEPSIVYHGDGDC